MKKYWVEKILEWFEKVEKIRKNVEKMTKFNTKANI